MSKTKSPAKFGEEAAKATKRQLIEALTSAAVEEGMIYVWADTFNEFRASTSKYFGEWLDDADINGIILRTAKSPMAEAEGVSIGTVLTDYLSSKRLSDLADEIICILESIPRTYEIRFPLPSLHIPENIKLSDAVSLVTVTPGLSAAGLFGGLIEMKAATYLQVRAKGFGTSSRGQSAMRDAMAILKRTIQAGVVKNIFVKREMSHGIINIVALLNPSTQVVLKALVDDVDGQEAAQTSVTLGLGMSSYLNELTILTDDNRPIFRPEGLRVKSATFTQDVRRALSTPVQLVTDPNLIENTQSLRSAFEWAFDAAAEDEVVPSFIKTCIALEAALGEDSEEGGITERLSDRCAYLLGKTPSTRKQTRERMRQVYRLRSELVHGLKTSLTHQDRETEFWGKHHLGMVLEVELNALETWWTKRLAQALMDDKT